MKTAWIHLLTLSAACLQLSCEASSGAPTSRTQVDSSLARDLNRVAHPITHTVKDTAERKRALQQLAELKRKFDFEADKIYGGGIYTPSSQATDYTFNKSYLGVRIDSHGNVYPESHYYGDEWIFHSKVVAKVGGAVLESDDIPSYDHAVHHFSGSGSVWETISFVGGRDNGIFEAVAKSSDEPIIVRFIGRDGYKEFNLSARDRNAIRDGYRLATLLQENGTP
jgi:hypothetical protein